MAEKRNKNVRTTDNRLKKYRNQRAVDIKNLIERKLQICVNSMLLLIIRYGTVEYLQKILDQKPEINISDDDGNAALHLAVKNKNKQFIHMLILHGAEIDIVSKEKMTPLQLAVINNNIEIVNVLLDLGADMNFQTVHGTPFHISVLCENMELVKLFVKKGINVNIQNGTGDTALHLISNIGSFFRNEVCIYLLYHGADITKKNNAGKNPLLCAIENQTYTVVKILLDYKFCLSNEEKRCALIQAIKEKCSCMSFCIQFTISNMLIDEGFMFSKEDTSNLELICDAVSNHHVKAVEQLLKFGANIETIVSTLIENKKQRITLLQFAAVAGNPEIVRTLLNHGADVHVKDEKGRNILFLAVSSGNVNLIKEFLKHVTEVDVHEKLENGATVLHKATEFEISEEEESLVKLFLKQNIDVNVKANLGETPLHYAAAAGVQVAVQVLLRHGADVNTKMRKNLTPLHIAIICGHSATGSALLLDRNININIQDDYGRTPLHIAASKGLYILIKQLLCFDADTQIKDFMGRTPYDIAVEFTKKYSNYGIGVDIYHSVNEKLMQSLKNFDLLSNSVLYWYDIEQEENSTKKHNNNCNCFCVYTDNDDFKSKIVNIFKKYARFTENRNRILNMKENLVEFMAFEQKESDLHLAQEVLLMQNEEINVGITLRDIMRKNYKEVATCLSFEKKLVAKLECSYNKLRYYKWLLKKKISAAKHYSMSKLAGYSFNQSLEKKLPNIVIQQIMNYLSMDDLKNILKIIIVSKIEAKKDDKNIDGEI